MEDDPLPLILDPGDVDPPGGERVVTIQGARARLRPHQRKGIPWTVFYPDWYLARYPDARAWAGDDRFDTVLRAYLDHGQAAGHSPNPFFDEAWYRTCYPDVAEAVADGGVQSGFDHYCRNGYQSRSPHWLFDELFYRLNAADLTDEGLAAQGVANGYGHYLRHGDREGRSGSPFFDPTLYAAQLRAADGPALGDDAPFQAFLRRLDTDLPELRTTRHFDPIWYRSRYPEAAEGLAAGRWHSALHHYLTNDTPMAYDPLPLFSERDYLARYPDIAAAVEAGHWRNGYRHFLATGAAEGRTPSPNFDPGWYVATHASVRDDLEARRAPDAFRHYLVIGQAQGLSVVPETRAREDVDPFAALYLDRARALLPVRARRKLDFSFSGVPDIAVIVLLRSGFALSMQALAGLRDHTRNDIELILVDCASTDETRHILRYVDGARLVRFEAEVPENAAINAALRAITAPSVLLLDDDTDIASGALDAAMHRLNSDAKIGAVGAKLVGLDGRLLSAGGIVWRDGSVAPYLRGAASTVPEANFVRDVDFCSRGFLLVRTAVLQEIDGFDEAFTHTGFADADLGLRIAASGHRMVYEPNALVYRRKAHDSDDAQQQLTFFRKHINQLRFRYLMDPKVEVFARSVGDAPKRVLFIEDLVPLRTIGSGFVRSNDLIHAMAAMGVFVTVYPMNSRDFDLAAVYADMPDTVEVMHDRTLADLDALFDARPGYYDLIWVARTHNLDRILPRLTRSTTGAGRPPRVVLDTEAVVALREAARRRVLDDKTPFDMDAAILQEFNNAHFCQNITAVTEHEAATLRALGFSDAIVVGHVRDLSPTPRAFEQRAGLLFVGAIHETASPNFDSLCWFVDEVLPLIEHELGWETRLSVVGYTGAGVSLDRFRHHPRVTLRGPVAETEPLYDAHRVFIAPTRYAGGAPYKVYEAASYGLPVVASDLLRQQLGWDAGKELMAADCSDPAAFARHVVAVYRDPALWQSLRDHALARMAAENSHDHYVRALTTILGK